MKKILILAALAISAAHGGYAQDIAGDWRGTLKAGGAEYHLILHVSKTSDGRLVASLDSVDQGATGIPVTSISLQDSKLDLSLDSIHAAYTGKVNEGTTAIIGTWTQGQALPLDFERGATPVNMDRPAVKPSDIDGDWVGTLDAGTVRLRLVFHITNTENGLTATLDSVDQNLKGMRVTSVTRDGSSLKLELKQINGAFQGKIAKDLSSIEGTWAQLGNGFRLTLKRVKSSADLERRRPQNPTKPYPYREEEVAYDNQAAGIRLAATLTIPRGRGPFPAVLLICGSGPHDRDESLMGHRPFLVLADYLTRKGIVVLRADKRGFGKSSGNFQAATVIDFASDAEAGVVYLKTRSEIDAHRIGLVGHSEGGIVAPILAVSDSDVAFVVLMAGPAVPGDQILRAQKALILEAGGMAHEQAEKTVAKESEIYELIKTEKDDGALEKKLREKLAGQLPDAQLDLQIQTLMSPWFRQFVEYDPATALSKLKVPTLAITGEKDLQVPPKQNLDVIRKALETAGNKNFEVDELPGLNHLFQTAKTGSPAEYGDIEETLSPVAMEKIAAWTLTGGMRKTN